MSVLTHLWMPVLLTLAQPGVTRGQDICQRCECLPLGSSPTQAICHASSSADKIFMPTTSQDSNSLELIYIYGIQTVNFTQDSIVTENPVTLLVQNCSEVLISDNSMSRLRTLLVREVQRVVIGMLTTEDLWAVVLEDIQQLTVSLGSLIANYSVSIGHVDSLILEPTEDTPVCSINPESTFTLFDTKVKSITSGGIAICRGQVIISNNTFEQVEEEGFQITADGNIAIVYNEFENVMKRAFNLSSPVIHISNNIFNTLPAAALRDISTIQDTFFVNNTVKDIDLGGVLLDMGWDMIVEHNVIECDCASKRTSILNPKHDMLYLSNSSEEKLKTIFLNNYCNLNCSVTLRAFSYALILGDVCLTNDTQLEQEKLCNISEITESTTMESNEIFVVASASRVEFLVPISIIVVTILLTSSVCYGCKEMNTFKFTFNPNREDRNKISLQ